MTTTRYFEMTDKQYLITEAQIEELYKVLPDNDWGKSLEVTLQSLPMVDSEPPRGVPNLEDFAKQLCTEHGTLDIYETVYRDQGNSYTPYSGQPAWSTYVLDAEYALNAYEKCSKLYTSPQALTVHSDESIAWESPVGSGLIKYVTDEKYKKFAPSIQSHYKPFKCAKCTTQALTPLTADDAAIQAEGEHDQTP